MKQQTLTRIFIQSVFILLFLQLFKPIHSFGQTPVFSKEFSIKVGTPYHVIDGNSKNYFTENNTMIAVKFDKKKIFIQKMDLKTMREISSREVTDMPKDYVYEGMVQVKGSVLFLFSLWDKKNEKEQLFVRPIDFEKGNFLNTAQLLMDVKGKVTGTTVMTGLYQYEVTDKFKFSVSMDSTKLLVRYRKKPETKNDSKSFDVIGFGVFNYNNAFTNIWNKEIKMPYTEAKMDELDFDLDSKGNAYLLAKVYEGEKKRVKDDDGAILYTVEILKFSAETKELSKIKVDLPKKYISSIIIQENAENNMSVAGFFSSGNKKESGADGVFTCKLTPGGEITNIVSYEIPLEILNQFSSKKEKKKNTNKEEDEDGKGAQFIWLTLKHIRTLADGGILLVGEQSHIVVTTSRTSSGGTMTHTNYYEDDILAVKIGADGKLNWMKRMPKAQVSAKTSANLSFKLIESDNNYYFLYMDNVKNQNLKFDDVPARHVDGSGGFLTTYKLNAETGNLTKLTIFDSKNVNGTEVYQFAPSRLFKGDGNDFYLEIYKKGKEDVLVRLSLVEDKK